MRQTVLRLVRLGWASRQQVARDLLPEANGEKVVGVVNVCLPEELVGHAADGEGAQGAALGQRVDGGVG